MNKRKTDYDMPLEIDQSEIRLHIFPAILCTHNIWRQSAVPTGLAGTDNSRKGKRRGTDFLEASTVLTYFVRS